MSWILFLAYLTTVIGFFLFYRIALPKGDSLDSIIMVSLLWPLIVIVLVLYLVSRFFVFVFRKIYETCDKR